MNRERWLQCQWHCTKNLVLKHFYSRFNSISYFYRRGSSTDKLNETKKEKGRQKKKKKNRKKHGRIQNKNRTTPSTPSIQKSSRFGNAVTRDEYTLSAIYGENCGQGAGDAGRAGAAGWLVAPKIARINIRARHCHSVNFPRCWLYRVRKEERGFARGVAWRNEGVDEGKNTDIPSPIPPPSMEFYALRVFNAAAHVWSARIFVALSPPPLTRYFGDTDRLRTPIEKCIHAFASSVRV